jgi:hypothetical protein
MLRTAALIILWAFIIVASIAAVSDILGNPSAPYGDPASVSEDGTIIYEDDCRLPGREPCDSNDDRSPLPDADYPF